MHKENLVMLKTTDLKYHMVLNKISTTYHLKSRALLKTVVDLVCFKIINTQKNNSIFENDMVSTFSKSSGTSTFDTTPLLISI